MGAPKERPKARRAESDLRRPEHVRNGHAKALLGRRHERAVQRLEYVTEAQADIGRRQRRQNRAPAVDRRRSDIAGDRVSPSEREDGSWAVWRGPRHGRPRGHASLRSLVAPIVLAGLEPRRQPKIGA